LRIDIVRLKTQDPRLKTGDPKVKREINVDFVIYYENNHDQRGY